MNSFQENVTSTINNQIQTVTSAAHDANARVLDTVVETNKNVVDFAVKTAGRFPTVSLPSELPVTVPTAAEAGERDLEFVERAAKMTRELNERVVEMLPTEIKPATKASGKQAAKRTAKKATTQTAKKAAAKK